MLRPGTFRGLLPLLAGGAIAAALVLAPLGCGPKKKQPVQIQPRYATLKQTRTIPPFLKDTIFERCMVLNTEPYLVNGYGVVANLQGTGDGTAPNAVRDYIVKEMVKHKVGSSLIPGMRNIQPEQVLRDPRFAIVQVDGFLPAGIRKYQLFDILVSAIPESNTTSLAHGDLWQTELRIGGANPGDPGGAVNVYARAEGSVFVNPAYALDAKPDDPAAKRSLRFGYIMNGGHALEDRPIALRVLAPSMRLARLIEDRVDTRFQEVKPNTIAAAQDEAIIHLFVPPDYQADWEHFVGVVTHLYLNGAPEFSAAKAAQLADEALKPEAPLEDISYCWEGLGKPALAAIRERDLMSNANPDVAFAATRAAAFLGDSTAPSALAQMATTAGHRFQINAVQTLGALRNSPEINEKLRPLLNSDQTLVRLEAYKMLARNQDSSIFSTNIRERFFLDVVRCDGTPVVYATRLGAPRLAIIGNRTSLDLPVTFRAMDGRLTISSDATNHNVTIFYRPPVPEGGVHTPGAMEQAQPIKITSRPDLAEIVARLGGIGAEGQRGLNFNYGEIVSILNAMIRDKQVSAMAGGTRVAAAFVLQELPRVQDSIYNAPVIPEQGRPQADEQGKVGMAR